MASLNKVQIIGNLGADPEMRFTANGRAVASMNGSPAAAATRRRTGTAVRRPNGCASSPGRNSPNCVSQYLSKGSQVYVEGRMQTREWQDREGQRRFTTEVVARDVQFLDRRGGGKYDGDSGNPAAGAAGSVDPDDLPFE